MMGRIYTRCMHRDHVPFVPPGFHLLGSTLGTDNQGMVRFTTTTLNLTWEDIHILTLQGISKTAKRLGQLIGLAVAGWSDPDHFVWGFAASLPDKN